MWNDGTDEALEDDSSDSLWDGLSWWSREVPSAFADNAVCELDSFCASAGVSV